MMLEELSFMELPLNKSLLILYTHKLSDEKVSGFLLVKMDVWSPDESMGPPLNVCKHAPESFASYCNNCFEVLE